MRVWLGRLGQAALILLITVALGEAVLRVFHGLVPSYVFYDHSYNRFRGNPLIKQYGFTLNSLGFKDKEFGPKEAGTYRILGIGDSFAFGVVPYDDNYLTLLESFLSENGRPVEVLNMGIPAIGPRDYLALLLREGLAFDPDLVLVSFFIGNDLQQSDRDAVKRPWYSYSHLFSVLHYLFAVRTGFHGGSMKGKTDYCDDCPSLDRELFFHVQRQRAFIYRRGNERLPVLVEDAAYYLARMRDACRERGIPMVVAILPAEIQMNEQLQAELLREDFPETTEADWAWGQPSPPLVSRLEGLGIETIDLYGPFLRESRHQRLYKPQDTHWNIEGNRLAARVLADHLRERLAGPAEKAAR